MSPASQDRPWPAKAQSGGYRACNANVTHGKISDAAQVNGRYDHSILGEVWMLLN
jgi:hypothetical protein